ncbi:MAG TPA: ACT domain-containing protein [Candidatus Avoscillospira avistercoris]|uniref:UPF0237 protein IAA83_06930 n=1 Tax=Candidatus Avoscillospira avistercoris TaxID=2840707 RepID=A0A9D1F9N3_9FIRM|nr:ACT domain-containing protein [Candidatus Avoscillospira avistercoris]
MRAIVTVVGPDRVGIIAEVCTQLAQLNINIIDISQTVMEGFFTMMMVTDTSKANSDLDTIADVLARKGEAMGLSLRIQREDIFHAMHKV